MSDTDINGKQAERQILNMAGQYIIAILSLSSSDILYLDPESSEKIASADAGGRKAIQQPYVFFRDHIRPWFPDPSFINLHYLYFIFTSITASLIFWGSSTPERSVSYVDSLFLCTSAMTEAGKLALQDQRHQCSPSELFQASTLLIFQSLTLGSK